MGKHSAPAPRRATTILSAATLAMSLTGLNAALAPSAEAASATKKLSGSKAPKKIDEPGSTKDVVRLPDVAGVTWSVSARPDATDQPTTTPTCVNAATRAADKYCDVSAKSLDAVRVQATIGGSTQSFPTMYFGKTKGILKLTSATSPRPVDRPGFAEDGVTLPTVKGISWKVADVDVDLAALKRGFRSNGPTGAASVTVLAVPNTDDYLVADDSFGMLWTFAFGTVVTGADVTLPAVRDLGGVRSDAVVLPHMTKATWYVNKQRKSTSATRPTEVRTNGKEVTVVATPLPGYAIPTTPAAQTDTNLTACTPATNASWAKPGSQTWTCAATDTPQQITAAALSGKAPKMAKDLGGAKNDSITLSAVPGVKWQVTTPAGVRTYSVASGTTTVALGYSPKTFGENYTVTAKPVAAVPADYSFATGADAETTLTYTSNLTVAALTGAVAKIDDRTIALAGVEGVTSWKVLDNGKTRSIRVSVGTTQHLRTVSSAQARVTPVFAYGYGASTTSAVAAPITPTP